MMESFLFQKFLKKIDFGKISYKIRKTFEHRSSPYFLLSTKKLFNRKYSNQKLLYEKNNFQNSKKTIFELY